jgi:hypothetical protein
VRVGIVGSGLADGLAKPLAVAADLEGVVAVPIAYEREEDAPRLVAEALPQLDAILFLGPVPHALARTALPQGFPATHIPYDGSGLIKALFEVHRRFGEDTPFSIDSIREREVLDVVDEVGGRRADVHAIEGESDVPLPRETLVARHLDLARRGVTRAAVTYIRSVHHELVRYGVPTVSIEPPASALRSALQQTALLGIARSFEATQLVVVMVRFVAGQPEDDATRRRQIDLGAQSFLLDLANRLEATLTDPAPGVYALITTKSGLDRSPDWEVDGIRAFERIGELIGMTPKVGIGFGETSREAETNAEHALGLAAAADSGLTTYVVFRDRAILGPLGGNGDAVLRTTRVFADSTLQLARSAGVNPASMALLHTLDGAGVFDAERLSRLLGLSVRSARRIAGRLVGAGLAEPAGEEQLHGRGRPRQLYRLVPVVPDTTTGRADAVRALGTRRDTA